MGKKLKNQRLHSDHKKSILIVDDDLVCRSLLQAMIEKLNYSVITASDGEEAYNALVDHYQTTGNQVLAIISDVMMPVKDGITFLEEVRGDDLFSKIPFVCVSSSSDKFFTNDAARFGASGYLKKPVAIKQLSLILENIEHKKRAV